MLAYNNQQMPNPMAMNGGGSQYQQQSMMPPNASPQPQQQPNSNFLNNYASDYLKTVKENRSEYGSHIDNSLAFDPAKEHKSMYNVVYETDAYNPWGKFYSILFKYYSIKVQLFIVFERKTRRWCSTVKQLWSAK